MLNIVARFTRFLLRHRPWVLAFFALLWAFDLVYVFQLQVNNEVERLVKPTEPKLVQYGKFLSWFGSDELALVCVERAGGIYDRNFLQGVERLEAALSKVPNAMTVKSVLSNQRRGGKLLYLGQADMAQVKADWLADPLNVKTGLIAKDGRALSLVVPISQENGGRKLAIPAIYQAVEKAKADPGLRDAAFHFVGQPFVNYTMDQSASEVGMRFFPVFFTFSILLSIFIYSSIMATIAALLTVGTASLTTIAFMAFLGVPMSLLTTALPVTLFIILLAGEVHFRNVFFNPHEGPETVNERLVRTMTLKWTATLISVATVQVGFGSLAFSDIPSIREFGLFIAFGMMVGLICHFTLFPVLISLFFRHTPPAKEFHGDRTPLIERWVHRLFDWTLAHKWRVFVGCTLATLIAGSSILFMKYETNPVNYLDESLPAKEGIVWFEKNMSGAANIEMVLESPDEGAFNDAHQLLWLAKVQSAMEKVPGVRAVVSVPEMLREAQGQMGKGYVYPETAWEVMKPMLLLSGFFSPELSAFLTKDGRHTRLTILIDTVDYVGFNRIMADIGKVYEGIVASSPPPHPNTLIFSGQTEMLTGITAYLASTLVDSLILTVVGVGLLLFLTFWSLRLTLMALLQNLFGIGLMFGCMWLMGIKLNTATILIASVLLGIEIDNTVHFLYHTRQGRSLGLNFKDAGHFNLKITGRAIGSTNFIIACGFAVFYLSDFPPIRHFGVLIAIGMVFAIAGVLVYLPAIVGIFVQSLGYSKKALKRFEEEAAERARLAADDAAKAPAADKP